MTDFGYSFLGFAGFGEESAAASYATAGTIATWIPIISESMQAQEGFHLTAGINNSVYRKVSQPGRRIVSGGINLEPDGTNIGWLMKWANRQPSADSGVKTLFSAFAPPPTSGGASPTSGGSLSAGTYRYKLAHAYNLKAQTAKQYLGSLSSEFSGTTASSNLTLAVTWTNASSVPADFTIAGTAIFRTDLGGSTGTEKYLTAVNGTGTSFNDDGTVTLTTIPVPTRAPNRWKWIGNGASDTSALHTQMRTFTMEVFPDVASTSLQHIGCKINQYSITIPGNGVCTATMNLHAQDIVQSNSPSTPSFTLTRPFQGFDSVCYVQASGGTDTAFARIEHFQTTLNNNLDPRYSLNGSRLCRRLSERKRHIAGSFTLAFEDIDQYQNAANNTDMSIRVHTYGPPVDYDTATPFSATINSVKTVMWPFEMEHDLPAISYTIEKANLNTDQQIIQDVPFESWFPILGSKNYDLQCSVTNLVSSYDDVA